MSVSEMTVLAIGDSRQIEQEFERYLSLRRVSVPNEEGAEDWLPADRSRLDCKVAPLLSAWKSEDLLFSVKYIDNDSVAASQMCNVCQTLAALDVPCLGVLRTDKYAILCIKPSKACAAALKKGYARRVIRRQPSERMLWINLTEAVTKVLDVAKAPLVVAVSEIFGPTRIR